MTQQRLARGASYRVRSHRGTDLLFVLTGFVALVSSGAAIAGENWPHWRGPAGTGVATETNLPTAWGTETNVAWRVEMPAWTGSTPIIWGEHIFLNVADGTNISLWCLDRVDGATRWIRQLSGGDRGLESSTCPHPHQ